MELRQLRYFLRLSETLNFSVASKELFITQSTLSQQILNLERELDQQLFIRNSHEVLLTEAGRMLLPLARESVYKVDNCFLRMQELKNMLTGELNIGVTYSFSSMISETMIDFLKKYPKVKLNVFYASMTDLIERLQRHELDFVVAFKPTEHNEHIESRLLFDNRLAAIVNEHHPLAAKQEVTLDELERYCFALPAKGLQARHAFDQVLLHTDHHYNVKAEINNVSLLLKLVRQTKFVTVLAEATIIDETGLRAVPINVPSSRMEGCIHVLRDGYMKNSTRAFIQMLEQCTEVLNNRLY